MAKVNGRYNVGGLLFKQPFKIRRLGHFGLDVNDLEVGVEFYMKHLGFRVTDELNFRERRELRETIAQVKDPRMIFTTHGTDHHAFVLRSKALGVAMSGGKAPADITTNQITWQVGTLEEIQDAIEFFNENGVPMRRVGRDMPGSNWHVYFPDPDGHIVELYYGIEQIGWNGRSKPREMYDRGFYEAPTLPQVSEAAEVEEAAKKGTDINSGMCSLDLGAASYNVGGILLPRPFKITKIGPVGLFVKDLDKSEAFYAELLGFVKTEEVRFKGQRCVFMRNGTEHHSLGLFPVLLRQELGLSAHTTTMTFGLEMGSYEQLRGSVGFLREKGAKFIHSIPPELYPGIDYAAHVLDPDGHCLQLYYYMEQVGWDGRPRPRAERRAVKDEWPEALEPLSDTYVDQTFQGPLG